MINSFCIETPVPVSGSAQGHLETCCLMAKVAYCHGKLLCPEEHSLIHAQLLNGQKLLQILTRCRGRPRPLAKNVQIAPEPQYSMLPVNSRNGSDGRSKSIQGQ